MSRRTISKSIRTYEEIKVGDRTIVQKRATVLPPLPDKQSNCYGCGRDMKVSDGQIRYYHSKACRKHSRSRQNFKKR